VDLALNYIDWKGNTKAAWQIIQNVKDDDYLEGTCNIFTYLNILDRNFNEVLNQLNNSKAQFENSYSNYIPNFYMKGLIYKYMGKEVLSKKSFDSSRVQLERMLRAKPGDNRLHFALCKSYAGLGNLREAIKELDKGIKLSSLIDGNTSYIHSSCLVTIYTLTGDYENALKQIDYLLSNPTGFSVNILKLNPLYDPLRNLPGYKEIIKKYST
jgi:tetratricopeptide (TPR) repeat protein